MGNGKIVARCVPGGVGRFVRDATLNDSDKSFTVPANKAWKLRSVAATIEASATVGSRTLVAVITNGVDVVVVGPRSGAITASQDGTYYWSDGGVNSITAGDLMSYIDLSNVNVVRIVSSMPSGGYYLPSGYVIRIYETAAVDAAADDLVVVLYYEEFDV